MKMPHDVYEVVKFLTETRGARIVDLAAATGRQQSALQRSLQGNPTIKLLMECGWAIGCDWHWFGVPLDQIEFFRTAGTIKWSADAPIYDTLSRKVQNRLHVRQFKNQEFDPADPANRERMAQVYPPKALEGAGGQPIDSRFIEAPLPEYDGPTPSHAARRTEDPTSYTGARQEHPVAATNAATNAAMAQSVPSPAQGPTPTDHELMATDEGRNQLRMRLTDVDCGGWVLSDAALQAGRVPVSQWTTTAGWTIDKMREHGYLVEGRLLGL